ncbi:MULTISPECIES: SHOCT domain-containing protein [Flavobacterium]|uniref:SHOCT domain-containing protein n=1 Tax=Flavobacterium TaxID=237 RepID=UPI0004288C5C|nr:SHOCT domain-containing protein [Flavobacterium frigidarium]NRT10839.1 putative membrane protein [Flavobacterium sp. 14A]
MMEYNNYSYVGMHLIWWFVWMVLLFWIFASPFNIPGQRARKDTPLDVLKKRLASGEIGREKYQEIKKTLELK